MLHVVSPDCFCVVVLLCGSVVVAGFTVVVVVMCGFVGNIIGAADPKSAYNNANALSLSSSNCSRCSRLFFSRPV